MANSPTSFMKHMTKIWLCMMVLKLVTVPAIIRKGNFILLDNEPDDLLYLEVSHHQWHLCNINLTELTKEDFYKYTRGGYISNDCYSKNFKKSNDLKYAIFLTPSSDKRLGPPTCSPLISGESYDWRCEKDMLSSAVTPYRNCTSVCKEGFHTVNNVTVRCSFMLDWIWFGNDKTPRCESRPSSLKAPPSNPNIPVHTTTSTPITDVNWILKNLTSLPLNSTSSRLTWMVSPLQKENPFPHTYRLSYRVKGETTYKEIILNGGSVNHTLPNLQKETVYDIQLCALGNKDRNKFCINMTTHITAAPPSNPNIPVHTTTSTPITDVNWILKNLTSWPLNSTSSRLTWMVSPLQKENPFPHTYRLSYRVKGETTYKEIILNGGSVNHTLPNLQKETVYDIQLCALGNKDRNKFCINMTTHITAAPPSNPNIPVHTTTSTPITDVNWILKNLTSLPLNSTSSRLTWMVSPLQKENPFPHTYRLSYRVKGETTYKEIILNGGSVNHTLPNLQKETVYDIQLCALGNKDRNKFCINMTTHITAAPPSNLNIPVHTTTSTPITDVNWILKNLTSWPLNSTSSRLTWMVSPLQKENPFPHTYRLSYRVKGETTYEEIILNGGLVNHTLTNLQKETVYDIQLCALGNKDRNKFCINMTTHITADKPVKQHPETYSKVYIIGGSIAGGALICIAVIVKYCCCKKNRSRGPYVAVPGRLSSSSSTSSQCSSGRCSCCFQICLNMDISLDNTVETSEITDASNYEDKNENNNAKDTDKEKKLVDSGREMCPIDSENIKEQLEDHSSELRENKNSRKTDESQSVDSGGEMWAIHLQKNERQLEDDSSESSENENSGKTEESQTVDSGGEMCPIDSHKNEKQLDDLSFENSEIERPVKPVETQTAEENKQDLSDRPTSTAKNLITTSDGSFKNDNVKVCGHSSVDKEGDRVTLGAAPSLSSLMDGSSGYASGIRNISVDLNRNDNRSHETENIVGSSVSNSMVAMEHIPGPRSIQEYHNDQMNQLIYSAQGVNPIVKPDSFDFNRVQDESSDQYHSIGQIACEQETYCDQRFPRVQRSSSSSGITLSDPGHDGRSQSSTCTDSLQNQETFPTEDEFDANITNLAIPQSNATNCNIQRSGLASTICTLSVEKAKEELSPEFFQILAYHLDPDSIYGNDKSWYGLTRAVLQLSEEKVKSIRHHTMGNTERGHFHETLEAYTAENKYMSDIVKYFVRPSSSRPDVIQFIKGYHIDCPVCNALYLQDNRDTSMSQSTQEIRRISTTHHKNNS